MQNNDVTLCTLNISNENMLTLESLSKIYCMNKTTIINKSIETQKFIEDVRNDGGRILIEDKFGIIREVRFR